MSEQKLMKDGLAEDAIKRLAKNILQHHKSFDDNAFTTLALEGLDELELKERVNHLIKALNATLPKSFPKCAKILQRLPKRWDAGDPDDPIRGFAAWPVIDYVAEYGLDHPEIALETLEILTPLFSAEFAIRAFIQNHFELTYAKLLEWCEHEDEHVRRLASEGSRPRLPWGVQLPEFIQKPKPLVPILEKLKNDPSLYVRRSVANNLNDISKDNPELTLKICKKWFKSKNADQQWIVKHACRSLVKQGHPDSFVLLGFSEAPKIKVQKFKLNSNDISLGDTLEFEINLKSEKKDQKFVLDYAIHFVKANKTTSPKVFKLKNLEMHQGESTQLSKKHTIKPITTRKYYPGKHQLAIHINGVEVARKNFNLTIK